MSFKTELAELLKKYDAQVVSAYDGHFGLEVEFETKEDGEYKYTHIKNNVVEEDDR